MQFPFIHAPAYVIRIYIRMTIEVETIAKGFYYYCSSVDCLVLERRLQPSQYAAVQLFAAIIIILWSRLFSVRDLSG